MKWLSIVLCVSALGCSSKEDARPSKIVFVVERAGTKSDLLLVDPQGGEPTPVAAEEAEDEYPSWSPDGLTLVFCSRREGHYGLYTWDNNKVDMLAGANYKDQGPSWSPNGRRIAYMSNRDNTWQIYSISASGKDEKRLTNSTSNDTFPVWSPDGGSILFQSDRGGQTDLYLMKVLPAEEATNPKPGPKGEAPPEVKLVEDAKPLTNDRAFDGKPSWSRTHGKIAWASKREGELAIWVMDSDGKNAKRLTPLDWKAEEPTWSPDGKQIAFVSGHEGFPELYVMNADGSGAKRLSFQRGRVHTPAWSPFLPPAK